MVESFRPELNTKAWAHIEVFVRAVVDEVEPRVAYTETALLSTLSRYVAWCIDSGAELKREHIFARRMIGYGVDHAFRSMSEASRGNMRSQLLRASEVLLDRSMDLPKLPPMTAADAAAPYIAPELVGFRNWARWQGTANGRQSAMAMIALGAGAGLTTRELAGVHPADITIDELGAIVCVRQGRPRAIPLLSAWNGMLDEALAHADATKPMFRTGHETFYPNIVTNFVARSAGVQLKPQMQRLRATWLVTHLRNSTPLTALLPAAGITSFESLSRYIRFLPGISDEAGRTALMAPVW